MHTVLLGHAHLPSHTAAPLKPALTSCCILAPPPLPAPAADNIKYFYDIKDRGDFRANPDYKGVCHVALAQEGHCKPGAQQTASALLLGKGVA